MSFNKGNVSLVVIVLVSLVVVGILGYYFLSKASDNKQANLIQNQDWLTYTNGKYGFRFQYDPSWDLNPSCDGKPDDCILVQNDITTGPSIWFTVKLQTATPSATTIEDFKKQTDETCQKFNNKPCEIVTFGKNNIKAVYSYYPGNSVNKAGTQEWYYFYRGGKLFFLVFQAPYGKLDESKQDYARVLSSFEFIN